MNPRAEVLHEAEGLVNGDRNASYGDPIQDFRRTAEFWTSYINGVFDRKRLNGEPQALDPHDVASMMELLKISRRAWSPGKKDSWVDGAGYVACGWDCVVEEGIQEA